MSLCKVFLFSDTWEQINGISSLYRGMFRYLATRRQVCEEVRLTWIFPSPSPSVKVAGPVTLVGLRPILYGPVPRCPELKTGIINLSDIASIEHHFGCPDVVHVATQGPFGLAGRRFAAKHGIRSSGFCHTNWPAYSETYLSRFVWNTNVGKRVCASFGSQLAKRFFAHCEIVFCHTSASAAQLSREETGQEVILVSEFLDTARFPICASGKPLKTDRSSLVLVYVGRLALEKSLDSLLQYSRYRGITVHVVGDGPLRPKLITEYPNAIYHGYLQGAALREVIEASDYLVLPSTTETLGLVVLEAAACGVPAILLRGEVPSEIVEHYSAGVLVDGFGSPEWIETAKAVRASQRYDALLKGCRAMAQSQSVEFGAKRMLDAWRHLVCAS
jgi:glycosyltransferase involved in cell wall biosynthesis